MLSLQHQNNNLKLTPMKSIVKQYYEYSDLILSENEDVRQKVLDKNVNINVNENWWQFSYEDFENIFKSLNFDKPTNFSFDLDRGNYINFKSEFDLKSLLKLDLEKVKSEYGDLDDILNKIAEIKNYNARINALVLNNNFNIYGYFRQNNYCNDEVRIDFVVDTYPNLYKKCEQISYLMEELIVEIKSKFLKYLKDEYEYLTSDEQILATIEANDYYFDENGKMSH